MKKSLSVSFGEKMHTKIIAIVSVSGRGSYVNLFVPQANRFQYVVSTTKEYKVC